MSDTQSITYNTGLNAVAVDSVGNLVTDSAGNLVIPIEPVIITVESESNHSDCKCAIVNVIGDGSQTFMPCVGNMPFRQNSINWLGKSTDIHSVQLVSNLRNINDETLSFDIVAGIQVHRPVGEFSPSYMQVIIQWGDSWIQSEKYYVCHQSSKVFNIGNISINLNNNTLTYTGVDLPTNASSVKCEQKEEPPEPEIIVIEAPYSWCGRVYSVDAESNETVTEAATIYTESGVPSTDDLVWASDRTEIKVDEGATDDEREEAITNASVGRITSVQKREYILVDTTNASLQPAHNTFWRDKDRDTSTDNWTPITGYSCTGSVTGNYLWVEQLPGAPGATTKRVWSASSITDDLPDSDKETHEVSKNLVEEDLPWVTSTTTDVRIEVHAYCSSDGNYYDGVLEGHYFRTGVSCGKYDRWAQLAGDFKPYKENCPCRGSNLYSNVVKIEDDNNLINYFMGLTIDITTGIAECSDGSIVYGDTATAIKGGLIHVRASGDDEEAAYFEYNNEQYRPNGAVGYVFEKTAVQYRAWTVSPCYEDQTRVTTLYTNENTPTRLFTISNGVATETQIVIVSSGTSVYSFKVGEGDGMFSTIHYWTGSMETNIDEEFE